MKNESLFDMLVWHEQVNDGIYPLRVGDQCLEIKSKLAHLSDADRLKMKRKFRKRWRGARKYLETGRPSLNDMKLRKVFVLKWYIKETQRKLNSSKYRSEG